jgi:GntR family transcriptional regulator, transcriptional repressor for pyruvate dehydrogenase complex
MTSPVVHRSLDAVSREGLTERAAAALRAYIVANRLAPGTRLPAGPDLASSLGVSHNVLRQAVASLVGLGMLRVAHGSGTYVADIADSEVFKQIAAWIGPESVNEHDYLEVRAIWERGIYELVLKRAQPADLDHLEELASAMLGAADPKELAAHHQAFHEALWRTTGNPFLVTLGTILQRFFWEFAYRDGLDYGPPVGRFLSGHGSIVQLLRSGDPEVVDQIIELHLAPHLGDEEVLPRPPDHGHPHVAKRPPREKEKTSQPKQSRQSKP